MATVLTTTYNGSATALTCGLATTPLASSSTFVLGRCSVEVDNTTNKYVDVQLQGKITVGTTPTANTIIAIYAWGTDTSIASLTYGQSNAAGFDTLVGTDADKTLTNAQVLNGLVSIATISVVATTSNVTYPFVCKSLAQFFGGSMPRYWGLFVTHNTGVALNATANNHNIQYTGITYTST